tara:strand:- start:1572 stop:1757 length:186 start_codon:yes stop_codon:yes gene_type:complete
MKRHQMDSPEFVLAYMLLAVLTAVFCGIAGYSLGISAEAETSERAIIALEQCVEVARTVRE